MPSATQYIVDLLNDANVPLSTQDIADSLEYNHIFIKRSSLNWTLTNLRTEGRVRRLVRGVYASISYEWGPDEAVLVPLEENTEPLSFAELRDEFSKITGEHNYDEFQWILEGLIAAEKVLQLPNRRFTINRPSDDPDETKNVSHQTNSDEYDLQHIPGITSVFTYQWKDGQIWSSPGEIGLQNIPANRSSNEREARAQACEILANNFLKSLRENRFQQCPHDYAEILERYLGQIPIINNDGNIYVADAQIRHLRNRVENDLQTEYLGTAAAAEIRTLLETHIGLRAFYPELLEFYQDVRHGKIVESLPIDVVNEIIEATRKFTGSVFANNVADGLIQLDSAANDTENASAHGFVEPNSEHNNRTDENFPPPDPIADIDQYAANNQATARAVNKLWGIFSNGEKVAKNLEEWRRAYSILVPPVREAIKWLSKLVDS